MPQFLLKNRTLTIAVLSFSATAAVSAGAFAQSKPTPQAKTGASASSNNAKTSTKSQTGTAASAEPDKVLYDRAMLDMKKAHYTEGRLALQTLINTYPDSEYLAKAKLGVADSYYKEGGTSNTMEAIQEYKDFITFFPFLDEAAYAQLQVAMAHYKMMEKPDRDRTEAESAEDEFQAFLLKYPQSPLVPMAEQKLREAQEVLADSQYRVARFYYLKAVVNRQLLDYSASAARLVDLSQRYPLYSQSDETLWMLGDIYARAKQASKNEDDRNHWADLAAECYSRIVRDYPLSARVAEAKDRLTAMGMPVPPPDPNAAARMQKKQLYEKQHSGHAFVRLPMSLIKSKPNVSMAARSGQPNLNPPDAAISATDVLKPGANGPAFNLAMRPVATDVNADSNVSQGAPVEAVSTQGEAQSEPGLSVGAQIIDAPAATGTAATGTAAAGSDPPASPEGSGSAASSSAPSPGTESSPASNLSGATPIPLEPASGNGASATSSSTPAAATGSSDPDPAAAKQDAPKADPKSESTSKKKKGIKKIVPL